MVFSPINLLLGAQDDAQLGGMFLERSQEKGGCYAFSILPSQKIFIFQFMTFFSIPICKVGQIAFFVKEKYTQLKGSSYRSPFCLHWTLMYHNGFSFLGVKRKRKPF